MSELFLAIEEVDIKKIKILLNAGENLNEYSETDSNYSPLGWAIDEFDELKSKETYKVIELLLQFGADPEMPVFKSYDIWGAPTPLEAAVLANSVDILFLLLKNGANPNFLNSHESTILRDAVDLENIDMVDVLIDFGAQKTINYSSGYYEDTALGRAVARKNIAIVERLLQAGADPLIIDVNGVDAQWYLGSRSEENSIAWDTICNFLCQYQKSMNS